MIILNKCRKKGKTDQQIIFEKGYSKVREEFNIFMVVQSIQKLKAAVSELVNLEERRQL